MDTLSGTETGLARDLAAIVGREGIVEAGEARVRYAHDQWWYAIAAAAAGRAVSQPDIAVRPRTTEEVSAVLRFASARGIPVTAWGGGSGVQGAANADRGGIVLDLRAMHAVRHVDTLSLTAVVEAGLACRDFEAMLNQQGLSFTHYPASTEWATIGGSIAARGSGVLSSKYGKIEEHILSLEWVLPTGEIVTTPAVPRHAAGPELTQLLVGAEGTLGIVTAASVRLRLLPKTRIFVVAAFPELDAGIEAGRVIMTTGLKPPVMRLYDQHAASHSLARAVETPLEHPTFVMMFDGEYPELVGLEARIAARVCAEHGGQMLNPAIGATWWERRYVFYYPPYAPELPSIWGTIDTVADFAHIRDVYYETTRAIRDACPPEYELSLNTHFSHWYEWGSMIYARMKVPVGPADLDAAKALHDAIFRAGVEASLRAGAVLNDHHGVGMRLAPFMPQQYGDGGMEALRRIKRALDPAQICAPGKLGL
jgi:alkyldihydroxyacetonephosphate synthase